MRLHRLHADTLKVIDRCRQADALGDGRRAGLEFPRQFVPAGVLQGHLADHVAAEQERLHRFQDVASSVEAADAGGAEHLVTEKAKKSQSMARTSIAMWGNALGAIHADQGAVGVRQAAEFVYRVDGAQHVGNLANGNQAGTRPDRLGGMRHVEAAVRRQLDVPDHGSGTAGDLLPGHQVAMVLERREHHFVTGFQVGQPPGVGHQVERLGGVLGKDHFLEVGIDEFGNAHVRLLVGDGGLFAQDVDAAVDVGVRLLVIAADGINDGLGFLGRRGAIEIDQRPVVDGAAEDRKIAPQGFNVESRLRLQWQGHVAKLLQVGRWGANGALSLLIGNLAL